jgi:hypothetical protein|tara:strand:- start:495 stop:779 length:285 start_codon:yes stop_codon:yes gene_type:complete
MILFGEAKYILYLIVKYKIMAIVKKTKQREIVIDLTGPDGNVFVLMGYARRFARDLGLDGNKIISEMQSSDYENAVEVFDNYFGSFVILLRNEI